MQAQFRRLTFDKGTIRDGRFTPDGQSIIYGAAWNGQPLKLFMVRTDSPESAPLSLPDARLLSVSKTGELAISLGHTFEGWMGEGTLARSSLLGSAPRVMAEHVREAEWTPDGGDLAVVRRVDGFERLEFPLGKVLYQTSGLHQRHSLLAVRRSHRLCRSSVVLRRCGTDRDRRSRRPSHGVVGRLDFHPRACVDAKTDRKSGLVERRGWPSTRTASMR